MDRILVIDDERMIREATAAFFSGRGFQVETAGDGTTGLEKAYRFCPDCILLDLMLPDLPGEEVCRRLRDNGDVPIIMLTAKSAEEDKLEGFAKGADDYVVKPFSLKELEARVRALLARTRGRKESRSFSVGPLTVIEEEHRVLLDGVPVDLTPGEYALLAAMMRHPRKVFTREELILSAFGQEYEGYDRAVDTHIKNLRRKLERDPRNPALLVTVYGVGYRMGAAEK